MQCTQTHDKFDSIPKRRVQQPTKRLTKLRRQLLSRETQKRSKRDDSDEVEDKGDSRIPVQCASEDTERHEDEEDVDIVAGERRIDQVQDMLGQRLDSALVLVVLGAADERGLLIVEPAVGGLRHVLLLVGVVTRCTTVTMEVSLYILCQAQELAM
jgi:hypothetical protein